MNGHSKTPWGGGLRYKLIALISAVAMLVAGLGAGVAYAVESGDSTADVTEQTQVASGQETSESQDTSEDSVAEGAEDEADGTADTADAQNAGQDGMTGGDAKTDDGSTDKADAGSKAKSADADANNVDAIDASDAGVSTLALAAGTVQGVSPRGTTIDLFDYTAPDINNGHEFQFNDGKSEKLWNSWTGNSGNHGSNSNWNYGYPRTRIVANTLDDDGYPKLSGETFSGYGLDTKGRWSWTSNQTIGTESLGYLFDDTKQPGKKTYQDVPGLLQVSDDGYYYYDSQKNFAHFDEDSNGFTLYDKPAVDYGSIHGQFFPFANMNNVNEHVQASDTLNYHFGVAMETQFMQSDAGRNNGKDVTYEFSGDDDVWVFIDGVLVGDLGGIHDPVSININFRTGIIAVNATGSAYPNANVAIHKTLRECFQAAGKEGVTEWSGNTFADDTYHTLNFFYMERGQSASNMSLKYNLVMIPQSEIQKVDQDGNPVPNAEFTLSVVDSQYQKPQQVYRGTTDCDGSIILMDSQRHAITLDNIWTQYSGSLSYDAGAGVRNRLNLILKETFTPSGYRSGAGEYRMYLWHVPNAVNGQESTLLLSDNPWTTGAYAQSKVSVTAPNTFTYTVRNGPQQTVNTADALAPGEGTLFAVVEKRSNSTSDDWRIVSGDALNGWKVRGDNDVATAVDVYKSIANTETTTNFELGRSGGYESVVANLPGRIQDYTYFAGDDGLYRGAYYYSSDASNVTSGNTYRVTDDSTKQFGREFSALLYVPNTINRVIVQKTDEAGNPVNDAEFTMYASADEEGTAPNYNKPVGAPVTTTQLTLTDDKIDLDGAAVFTHLNTGIYWIVETAAPAGYAINKTPSKVIVTDNGVYADAGEAGDGIEVTRGVGRIVRSMVQFATDDDIDATLHHIVATPQIRDAENNSWTDVKDAKKLHLHYGGDGKVLDYGVETPTTTDNRRFTVDEGIPYLKVQQCNDVTAGDNVHDETESRVFNLGNTDISNLFTGVTIVQVTDQRLGKLNVTKQVTGNVPTDSQNLKFEFTVTFTHPATEGGEPAPMTQEGATKFGMTIAVGNGAAQSVTMNENGAVSFSLYGGETAQFVNVPTGVKYAVAESKTQGFDVSYDDKQTGAIPFNDTISTTVTNSYVEHATLDGDELVKVRKTVAGTQTDDDFTFELQLSQQSSDASVYEGQGVGTPFDGMTVVMSDHFTDGQPQSATFDAITFTEPGTYMFEVKEWQPDPVPTGWDYDGGVRTVTVTVGGDWSVSVTYNNLTADTEADQQARDCAAFTNRFGKVSGLPLTGGDSTARTLLLAGGGVLLVAGVAWLLARRRRV